MKRLSFLFTALSLGLLMASSSVASEGVQTKGAAVGKWTMDYDAAVKLAGEKKVPMMLNFTGSDWCGWCKLMDKSVFAEETWTKFAAEKAVLVTIDFPKDKSIVPEDFVDRNRKLQEQFGVQGFPTYVVLESDGKTELGRLQAGRDKTPESFIKEFEGVTRMSASSVEAFAKANPDKAEDYKKAVAKVKSTRKALGDWIATGPEVNDENNKKYAKFQEDIKEAETTLAAFN